MNASQMEQEVLREIPGYKAILKSVLKSQIQFLHHKASSDVDLTYQRSRNLLPPSRRPKPRLRPGPYSIPSPGTSTPVGSPNPFQLSSPPNHGSNQSNTAGTGSIKPDPESGDMLVDSVSGDNNNDQSGDDKSESGGVSTNQDEESGNQGNQKSQKVKEGEDGGDAGEWDSNYDSAQGDDSNTEQDPIEVVNHLLNVGSIANDNINVRQFLSPEDGTISNLHEPDNVQAGQLLTPAVGNIASFSNIDMSSSGKGTTYWCQHCQKVLQNKMLYNYHVRAHMGVKPFECPICQRKFAGKQALETHKRLHSGERPFKCTHDGCDRAFTARRLTQDTSAASNGVSLSPGANLGPYDLVPRKRGRPRKDSYLYMNEASQNTSVAMESPSTTLTYTNATDQAASGSEAEVQGQGQIPVQQFRRGRPRKEYENLPPGVIHPTGISIGNGYVKCNICGKILKGTSMFTHKQAHLGIRNYSCNYCGKSFTQKGPLITHERVHTGEKPYSCNMCGKSFSAHSGLYQHRRRCSRQSQFSQFNITM
ncbi:ZKSC5-like protein [Mya arenaria]|uniref:ZKSC5-like protein n=1 Tax=Mya arenaria TaxID=6604 RepID=A0ABY7EZU9_MYAAR|nr:ZKSC5-like protein [Mya arenaria]